MVTEMGYFWKEDQEEERIRLNKQEFFLGLEPTARCKAEFVAVGFALQHLSPMAEENSILHCMNHVQFKEPFKTHTSGGGVKKNQKGSEQICNWFPYETQCWAAQSPPSPAWL